MKPVRLGTHLDVMLLQGLINNSAMVYILFLGEEPVQKKPRIEQSFWANIRSATEESKNDDDKSDEHDDKPEPDPEPELSSTSLLVFSDVIPHHDTNNQLYIRQAYIDIYEMYIEKNDFILVSGTPGVGKTIFSFYVLYRLLKAVPDASVLYASAKGNYAVYLEGDNVVVADNQEQFRECATYYMFDCGDGSKMQIDIGATSASRKTIVFSSPNKKHYKEYEKSFIYSCERKGVIVYMPTWSLMELQFCRRHLFSCITSEGLERRYNLWGGVPRAIFNISESNGERLLRGLIVTNSLKDITRLATSIHASQFDSVSHRILHLHVEQDKDRVNYEDPVVIFASKWVAQQVYDQAECESVLSLTNVMSNAAKHTPLQGLCGQIFESFCHTQLSSGRTFTVKSLTSETTIPKVWKCSKRDTFRDLMEAELSENIYYVPENPNFESVDAVVPPDTAVQITVSLKHPVKMHGLQYVKDALGCQELKLYFAVPENIYESFQKQPYHTQKGKEWKKKVIGISQWAVCVPIKTQP